MEEYTHAALANAYEAGACQLPFAVFPLVRFTTDRHKMGEFTAPGWVGTTAWGVAFIIAALNVYLLYRTFVG